MLSGSAAVMASEAMLSNLPEDRVFGPVSFSAASGGRAVCNWCGREPAAAASTSLPKTSDALAGNFQKLFHSPLAGAKPAPAKVESWWAATGSL